MNSISLNKILIVDDERTVIQQVDSLLESFGYKSDFIPKANFLIKKLETETFDLILMDINMPGIDGITALKMIKENHHYKDIPVIMMTADTSEQTLENCFIHGAADFITKPIQELVLKSRVKSVIEKQQYIAQIEKQRKNIVDSINYAKTIQDAMLPKLDPLKIFFTDAFVLLKPKDIVSGDFYMIKQLSKYFIVVVADCTGHGVPGAFMSMLGMSLINEIIRKADISKANQILIDLRNNIKTALHQDDIDNNKKDGMDMSLIIIDTETLEAQFAGANRPLFIIKNDDPNNIIIIEEDNMPIGSHSKEHDFTNNEITFTKNDTIYMFSDGYVDQFGGENNRKFKNKLFFETILEIQSKSMAEQCEILNQKHINWKGNYKQTDDILILGIKI